MADVTQYQARDRKQSIADRALRRTFWQIRWKHEDRYATQSRANYLQYGGHIFPRDWEGLCTRGTFSYKSVRNIAKKTTDTLARMNLTICRIRFSSRSRLTAKLCFPRYIYITKKKEYQRNICNDRTLAGEFNYDISNTILRAIGTSEKRSIICTCDIFSYVYLTRYITVSLDNFAENINRKVRNDRHTRERIQLRSDAILRETDRGTDYYASCTL